MSKFFISLLLSIGASGWIYTKLQNRSGRNTQQSLTATAVAGLIIFIITLIVLSLIL